MENNENKVTAKDLTWDGGYIDISGLDKAEVLKALYDGSHTQGISFLGLLDGEVTIETCRKEIERRQKETGTYSMFFDYYHGHVLKVNIGGDTFDPSLYDRDCGSGKAFEVIKNLRIKLEEAK